MSLDVNEIRKDFPILQRKTHDSVPLVYLDSTATSQKPLAVIEAMDTYYRRSNANIHRGVHTLAEEATALYEAAREKIAKFINAASARQIIYTRNTTESINLVAHSWARSNLEAGDLVILTEMEHHSNLVPWHMLQEERGIELDFIPVTESGLLDLDVCKALLSRGPKLVAFTHMSNVLGTINPAAEMIRMAHAVGAVTLVDAAQSVPHLKVDVQTLDADFLAFSAHKMCGPTGIGVLYGKANLLENMPPFLGGGDMIDQVELECSTWAPLPHKFEAGTPHIAGAVGMGAAVDFLEAVGRERIAEHERMILAYGLQRLAEVPDLTVLGPVDPAARSGVISFTLGDVHPHDLATILDAEGVAIRAGHHCAQPLMRRLDLSATARASFYLYSTCADVDRLVDGLNRAREIFA